MTQEYKQMRVRLQDYEKIARVAKEERRPLTEQVSIIVEQFEQAHAPAEKSEPAKAA